MFSRLRFKNLIPKENINGWNLCIDRSADRVVILRAFLTNAEF